jgi:hypothetical protein
MARNRGRRLQDPRNASGVLQYRLGRDVVG